MANLESLALDISDQRTCRLTFSMVLLARVEYLLGLRLNCSEQVEDHAVSRT